MIVLVTVTRETWAIIISSAAIIIYFALMLIKRRLLGKDDTKKSLLINIILNIIILGFAGWLIIFMSGAKLSWQSFSTDFINFLKKQTAALIGSVLVIIVSMTIYNLIKVIMLKSKHLNHLNKRKNTLAKVLLSFLRYFIYLVDIAILLRIWGIDVAPILAGLGIAGLVLGLGAQQLIKDFISGLFIIFEHHFDVGDIIKIGDFKGEVIDIGLKTTRVRDWRGDVKLIGNGSIDGVINYTMYQTLAVVEFEVAYRENIGQVIDLLNTRLTDYLPSLPSLLTKPQVSGTIGFGKNGVALRIVATTLAEQHYEVERAIIKGVKELFDKNGLKIPVTQIELQGEGDERIKVR